MHTSSVVAGALLWFFLDRSAVHACQTPLRPIYNSTQNQYVSCNAWEPDCPRGSFCQLTTPEWKAQLQINSEFTLFLCCADENVFKNSHHALIVPPTTVPPAFTPPPKSPMTTVPFVAHQPEGVTERPPPIPPSGGNQIPPQQQQPPFSFTPRPMPRNGVNPKQPVLPPQAQIMLPGNGNRIVDGPQVVQLMVGEVGQGGPQGMYKYAGSVTLVQDSGINVLVDSGSAQSRNRLLAALAQQGIKPQNIQVIVYTHAHPDHIGNDNLFPYAQKIYSTSVYKGDEYMPLQYMQEPSMRLTQNIEVWQTPGHTYQHNSVIVRNVPAEGTVAVSGDLFMNEEGMTNSEIWESVSVNKEVQLQMRNLIICQVEYIIPGHGKPFKVTPEYRSTAGCTVRKKTSPTRNNQTPLVGLA